MSLTIIIPTYENVDYLDELFDSIEKNNFEGKFEVFLGIDNCEKTKKYIEEKKFDPKYKFFYFKQNVGPYKIKNTLAQLANFDKLFFFDSDDIMLENCIIEIDELLNKYECVKPRFINFNDNNGIRKYKDGRNLYGEGVFGIDKNLFLSMNGFEGWRCAADSDFMARLYKMKRLINLTKNLLFHRRLHQRSLTADKKTGYASKLRAEYYSLSKNKKNQGILPYFEVAEFDVLEPESGKWLNEEQIADQIELNSLITQKEKKQQLISSVFNEKINKDYNKKPPKSIDYSSVNKNTNVKSNLTLNVALKKAKLENIQKNSRRR